MTKKNTAIALYGTLLALIIIGLTLSPFITMIAWNSVMPYLFGLKMIDFWMALAINVLTGMFFKTSNYIK